MKVEPRRHGATGQGVVAQRLGTLPGAFRHDDLRPLPRGNVVSEHMNDRRATPRSNRERERTSCVPMPDFADIDAVPMRGVAGSQKKINGGRTRATIAAPYVAKDFAKVPTFGMRTKVELAYEKVCVVAHKGCVAPKTPTRKRGRVTYEFKTIRPVIGCPIDQNFAKALIHF